MTNGEVVCDIGHARVLYKTKCDKKVEGMQHEMEHLLLTTAKDIRQMLHLRIALALIEWTIAENHFRTIYIGNMAQECREWPEPLIRPDKR